MSGLNALSSESDAMRRPSSIDQRIDAGVAMRWFLPWFGASFSWRRRIGAMADRRHYGNGEHHQGNVAISLTIHASPRPTPHRR